jgi:hypothetical protein
MQLLPLARVQVVLSAAAVGSFGDASGFGSGYQTFGAGLAEVELQLATGGGAGGELVLAVGCCNCAPVSVEVQACNTRLAPMLYADHPYKVLGRRWLLPSCWQWYKCWKACRYT